MCGIAGIVTKYPRLFDYETFCTLGIGNDLRGGDSCGIFIDGKYDYGVGDKKYFQCYFPESKILKEIRNSSVAFLHCRKASVGNISKETAQPVILTNESGKVVYVLMHNGTIYNYKELAEKYIPNIDITGLTDSQVMARIFYYSGYEALSEYNGGSVFAIADYRENKPKILLFKGCSKDDKWSKKETDERPLCYCIDPIKKELVFSSIGVYLLALRRDCELYTIPGNTLVEFTGTDLVIVGEYSRKNAYQKKNYSVSYGERCYNYYNDAFWENEGYYNDFISYNSIDYTYSAYGKKCHGEFNINKWGHIYSKPNKKDKDLAVVWFFNGVTLKNSHCYKFLSTLLKTSHLTEKEFCEKYKILIRFLSVDEIYIEDSICYRAVSPTNSILFSGKVHPLFGSGEYDYEFGIKKSTSFNTGYPSIKDKTGKAVELNFKQIREECKL